jgi:hypothetical protein
MGQEGHSQREGRVAEKGREPTIPEFVMADRFAPMNEPARAGGEHASWSAQFRRG